VVAGVGVDAGVPRRQAGVVAVHGLRDPQQPLVENLRPPFASGRAALATQLGTADVYRLKLGRLTRLYS